MQTVSVTEFRGKHKKIFRAYRKRKLVIHRNKGVFFCTNSFEENEDCL
jgi:hypothetical protein